MDSEIYTVHVLLVTGIEVNGEVYFPRLRVIAQVLKARTRRNNPQPREINLIIDR